MDNVFTFTPRTAQPEVEEVPEANLGCGYCDDGIVFQLTESGAYCLWCGELNTWDEIGDTLDDDG